MDGGGGCTWQVVLHAGSRVGECVLERADMGCVSCDVLVTFRVQLSLEQRLHTFEGPDFLHTDMEPLPPDSYLAVRAD